MTYIEKTAKSVEEAVSEALRELNIPEEAAKVEVLDKGSKGFLGIGRKEAKVRVSLKGSEERVKTPGEEAVEAGKKFVAATAAAVSAKAEELKAEAAQRLDEAKEGTAQRLAEVRNEAGRRTAEYGKRLNEAKENLIDSGISTLEALKGEKGENSRRREREARHYVVSDEAVASAKDFLQQVFAAMKMEIVLEKFINKNDGTITFRLHGEDLGILIGKHGQTLDSLQYLTNLAANKNSSERARVIIDVEDYRDRRSETLTRLAHRLADKVKRSGEAVALEPMNPHERKIIHMALQSDRRVTTSSEGEEPYRHVVIELKK